MVNWHTAIAKAGELSDKQIVTQIRGPAPESKFVTLAHDRGAMLVEADKFQVVLSDGSVHDVD